MTAVNEFLAVAAYIINESLSTPFGNCLGIVYTSGVFFKGYPVFFATNIFGSFIIILMLSLVEP